MPYSSALGVIHWHLGRCGSSVLGSLLNQHSAIQAENEIFSRYMPRRRGEGPLPTMPAILADTQRRRRKPVQLIEIKYLRAQNLGLYPAAELRDWLEVAQEHGFSRHLLLHRRNGLRRIVSHLLAQVTGAYVLPAHQSCKPDVGSLAEQGLAKQVHVDCQLIREGFEAHSLLEWLDIYDQAYHQIQDALGDWDTVVSGSGVCSLSYEDDVEASPFRAYEKICAFLDVPAESPVLKLRRINPEPLPVLIRNYREVEVLLQPTRFSWMLDA